MSSFFEHLGPVIPQDHVDKVRQILAKGKDGVEF